MQQAASNKLIDTGQAQNKRRWPRADAAHRTYEAAADALRSARALHGDASKEVRAAVERLQSANAAYRAAVRADEADEANSVR